MTLNYNDSCQVSEGVSRKRFSAKYLLWYSWQSQASVQPSVPAPPPSAVNIVTDFIRPYYCFHSAAVTVKLKQDKAFWVLAASPQAS